jgi:kynurenine formamidase
VLILRGHHGTHLDALGHISYDGRLYGGIPASEAQSFRGLTALGIETVSPIVARFILFDLARTAGRDEPLEPGQMIGRSELERSLDSSLPPPASGDVALIRTGWGRYWEQPSQYRSPDGFPGINLSAAEWLAERGVAAIGSDTLTVEAYHPTHNRDLPVHAFCLVNRGIYLLENLYLEELARHERLEGLFVALPLKIVGATASPVRPIAIA